MTDYDGLQYTMLQRATLSIPEYAMVQSWYARTPEKTSTSFVYIYVYIYINIYTYISIQKRYYTVFTASYYPRTLKG